nr:hypothetical protein [Tanacetum cinerariifolium]
IVVRKAGSFNAITKSEYKHLYKNDIENLYMLCVNDKVKDYRETGLLGSLTVFIRSCVIWERVHDFQLGIESYQQKVNLTAPTTTFPGIERKKPLTITFKHVVGLIYENNKKEKRVMIVGNKMHKAFPLPGEKDDKVKENENGMTHCQGVKRNNCQAILQGLEYLFQSHPHLPQCPEALGHPS